MKNSNDFSKNLLIYGIATLISVPSSSTILRGLPMNWEGLRWVLNGFSGECYGVGG